MHNGKYQCHMAASCTYHRPSSPSCSTRAIQKSLALNEKYLRVFWKKVEKTREEIGKGNQMTALRFHTGGRHQTSPASLRGSCRNMLGGPNCLCLQCQTQKVKNECLSMGWGKTMFEFSQGKKASFLVSKATIIPNIGSQHCHSFSFLQDKRVQTLFLMFLFCASWYTLHGCGWLDIVCSNQLWPQHFSTNHTHKMCSPRTQNVTVLKFDHTHTHTHTHNMES